MPIICFFFCADVSVKYGSCCTRHLAALPQDADVAIYINVALAMQSGICFVQSSNGVILTVGHGQDVTLTRNDLQRSADHNTLTIHRAYPCIMVFPMDLSWVGWSSENRIIYRAVGALVLQHL